MKERYPENTCLSADEQILEKVKNYFLNNKTTDYWSIHSIFAEEAGKASDSSDYELAKILWLIADISSLTIKPESTNEPFGPFIVTSHGRSAITSDFKKDEINYLLTIIDCISSQKFKARVYDLAWLMNKPRNINNAICAIEGYLSVNISIDDWINDSGKCLERAIRLCIQIREPAINLLDAIEHKLVKSVLVASSVDGYLPLWILELILKYSLSKVSFGELIERCIQIGEEFSQKGDRHRAKDYYLLASKYQKTIKKYEDANLSIIRCIDEWDKEEIQITQKNAQTEMQRTYIFENAIKLIRSIPRELRSGYGLDVRLEKYMNKMNEANEFIVRNMVAIQTPAINIADIVKHAKEAVQGKSTIDALKTMLNIYAGANEADLRSQAENSLKQHSIIHLFQTVHYSHDGRVVRRVPGSSFSGAQEPELVWAEMMRDYQQRVGFYVQSLIYPALEVFQLEHRLSPSDFISICYLSPLIPPGREDIFGRALFYGYDSDFLLSIHLLTPQVENLVRYHLKMNGIKTTTFDSSNTETENGLSTLVEISKLKNIFGDNIVFEIKALFCDNLGANLRNEVAHGLLNSNGFITASAIYAWWFIARLVLNTYLNSTSGKETEENADF